MRGADTGEKRALNAWLPAFGPVRYKAALAGLIARKIPHGRLYGTPLDWC